MLPKIIFLIAFILVNSHQILSLTLESQKNELLTRLGVEEPSAKSLNDIKSCVNFFRNLELNQTVDRDEVKCFDETSIEKHNLTFKVNSSFSKDSKLMLKIRLDDDIISNYSKLLESENRLMIAISDDSKNFYYDNMINKFGWISVYLDNYFTTNDDHLDKIKFEIRFLIFDKIQVKEIDQRVVKESFLISFTSHANAKLFEKINSRRRKRQFDNDEEDLGQYLTEFNDRDRHCEAVPIYYRFEDFGWDSWIISPKGFMSNFCQGRCSFPLKSESSPSNHAIVQSLMQLMYSENYPEPCCSPGETESLQIAYFDKKNTVRFKKLDNIIVKSCRCT